MSPTFIHTAAVFAAFSAINLFFFLVPSWFRPSLLINKTDRNDFCLRIKIHLINPPITLFMYECCRYNDLLSFIIQNYNLFSFSVPQFHRRRIFEKNPAKPIDLLENRRRSEKIILFSFSSPWENKQRKQEDRIFWLLSIKSRPVSPFYG